MDAKTISREDLTALVQDLIASGASVAAPARAQDGGVDYRPIGNLDEVVLEGGLPRRSLKEFFLPPTEPLFSWRQKRADVEIEEAPAAFPQRFVIGARPCDTAALEVVDKVMAWDYRDEPWFGRREATMLLSFACPGADGACFCEAVGLSPEAKRGADLFLAPAGAGYRVEVLTEKGRTLVEAHAGRFRDVAPAPEPLVPATRETGQKGLNAPMPAVRAWLEAHFEHDLWREVSLRCHGCGACASVCPTCHCFDIVDEPEGVSHGTRRRNWDTCQTGRFTVHASGHNPRADQAARYRQRVMHKFAIYPARFGEVLCTGCGRCSRACPGGMDLPEVLGMIAALSREEGTGKEATE